MNSQVESGYLVLADISGYTGFLADTELDHAHEILGELIGLISDSLTSVLTLAEVEGDAVFVYAPASRMVRGETVMELVEKTFADFRDRRDTMQRGTTCTCRACQAIPTLDLKFITHFGSFILNMVAGRLKPVGSDINLIHRLLKNSVTEATGWSAYALYTDQALKQMELAPDGMRTTIERYERLGEVVAHSSDLDEQYRQAVASRHYELNDETAFAVVKRSFGVAPPILWEWINDLEKRSRWMEGTVWKKATPSGSRTSVGGINHCHHGSGVSIERILDWKPFEYTTTKSKMGPLEFTMSFRFIPEGDGTRLEERVRIDGPLPGPLLPGLTRLLVRRVIKIEAAWDRLEQRIAAEPQASVSHADSVLQSDRVLS